MHGEHWSTTKDCFHLCLGLSSCGELAFVLQIGCAYLFLQYSLFLEVVLLFVHSTIFLPYISALHILGCHEQIHALVEVGLLRRMLVSRLHVMLL